MILQRLYQDADAILKQTSKDGKGGLPPSMYMKKRVKWIIDLFTDPGYPIGYCEFQPTPGDDKKGVEQPVPFVKRTAGVRPLLLADKTSYTLGLRIADPKRDTGRDLTADAARTMEEHTAYKSLIRDCADKTGNPAVKRIAEFLETWDPANPPENTPPELGRDDLFTFRVDGAKPIDLPAVQKFWAEFVAGTGAEGEDGAEEADGEPIYQCLVSEEYGEIVEMMPVPVKGLPGGKSEMAIVSANAAAFESYGLKRAQTSPISREAGERFGQALNALIASESHRVTGGNVVYVFWTRGSKIKLPAFNPGPDSRDIRKFITAVWRGDTSWAENLPKTDKFYLYGLTANAARVVVRSAIETDIETIGKFQAEWFQRLQITGPEIQGSPNFGPIGYPLPLRTLAAAAYREFKDIPDSVDDALIEAAFTGRRLPESLLQALVLRCRLDVDNRVTYPRAALMKYIVTQTLSLEESEKMSSETTGEMPPAYHCGRLLAELEAIQKDAIPGLNATITDRFYGSASSSPASVFGLLLSGAQNHLSKLRKEKGPAFRGATRRLEEILAEIGDFPKTLPLRDQALFSLGYYHHKAAKRKDIAERSAAKKKVGQLTLEGVSEEDATPDTEGGN